MADNTVAADLANKLFGQADTANIVNTRLMRIAVQLLADGEPVAPSRLAEAAGITKPDLAHAIAGQDIEYDDHGRIIGWGLTHNPTPHKFTVNGKQFYTWCAPDTLVFPALIGHIAHVESPCPTTGTIIRLTVDPDAGVTALEPSTAVVSVVDPSQIDPTKVRATVCNPQHFFATADAARDWQSQHPAMRVLPVDEAYHHIMVPLTDRMLDDGPGCC